MLLSEQTCAEASANLARKRMGDKMFMKSIMNYMYYNYDRSSRTNPCSNVPKERAALANTPSVKPLGRCSRRSICCKHVSKKSETMLTAFLTGKLGLGARSESSTD